MDQLVPSNGRPISVNEHPLPIKPIANDIRRDAAGRPSPGDYPVALRPGLDRNIASLARLRRIEITLTNRENEFPPARRTGAPAKTGLLLSRFSGVRADAAYRFVHYPNFN